MLRLIYCTCALSITDYGLPLQKYCHRSAAKVKIRTYIPLCVSKPYTLKQFTFQVGALLTDDFDVHSTDRSHSNGQHPFIFVVCMIILQILDQTAKTKGENQSKNWSVIGYIASLL